MRRIVKALVPALFLLMSSTLFAGEDPYESHAWKGEITIQYSLSGNHTSLPTNNPNRTEESMYTESKEGQVVIGACFKGGGYKWIESNDFNYSRTDKMSWENAYQRCGKGSNEWTARPGRSGFARQTVTGHLDTGSEPRVMVNLMVRPNGTYFLMATGGRPYLWSQNGVESETWPCSGNTRTINTILSPDIKERSREVSSSGDTTLIKGPTHPATLPLMVNYQGTYSGKIIEGETVIMDKQEPAVHHLLYGGGKAGEGVWQETMTASWRFEVVDPCQAVTEQLGQSMAFLAAYNDVTLLNSGLDGRAYDEAIGKLAGEIYSRTMAAQKGGGSSGGEYRASTDLGVDIRDCKLVGKDAYEDAQKKSCQPEIIFDAVIAHEMKHVGQCESDRGLFIRGHKYDPVIQSKYEIEAYCTEIGMYFKWLDRNCGEDLSGQKDMVNSVCN